MQKGAISKSEAIILQHNLQLYPLDYALRVAFHLYFSFSGSASNERKKASSGSLWFSLFPFFA